MTQRLGDNCRVNINRLPVLRPRQKTGEFQLKTGGQIMRWDDKEGGVSRQQSASNEWREDSQSNTGHQTMLTDTK